MIEHLTAADGTEIAYRKWPAEETSLVVQYIHGGAEHGGRYEHLAAALNGDGITVYAQDHRGHGLTAVTPGDMGGANAFVNVCGDELALTARISRDYPGTPIVIFGHSLGSLITQRILIEHSERYHAAILSGSPDISGVVALKDVIDAEVERVGRGGVSDQLEAGILAGYQAAFPSEAPNAWLSRDEEQVALYVNDPLCGFALCSGAWQDLAQAMAMTMDDDAVRNVRADLPILIYSGEKDPVHNSWQAIEALERRYGVAGVSDLVVNQYAGGRHEMLHEINRDEVIGDIVTWLSARRS